MANLRVLSLCAFSSMILVTLPCAKALSQDSYTTEYVVIAVMDGVHYDRTFGDPEHSLIPHLWNDMRPQGTYYTRFYNNGVTITMAAHSTLMTGTWQYNRNRGPFSTYPTIVHYMADEIGLEEGGAWIIFGKGLYAYNPETSFLSYNGTNEAGHIYGLGEATYQDDYDVLNTAIEKMEKDHPRILLANFGTTDHTAHSGNWEYHTGAVKNNDIILYKLWNAIQDNPHYTGKTTLIVTNDHGYQDDGIHDGFAEHGDASEGSRHVMLLIIGPDIKKNHVVDTPAYLIDIAPTVGELLGFQTPLATGENLRDAFINYRGNNKKEAKTARAREAVEMEQLAQLDLIAHVADGVLEKYGNNSTSLKPKLDTAILLWGMLFAYDRTADVRYLDFVRLWADGNKNAGADAELYAAFTDIQLAYRLPDYAARKAHTRRAEPIAYRINDELEAREVSEDEPERLALRLIFVAAVAEKNRDEALWHRVANVYFKQVREMDLRRAKKRVMEIATSTPSQQHEKEGEVIEATGKVLPDLTPVETVPQNSWYMLAAAFLRGHGLPYKGENLPDMPRFHAEVLYQTYLAVKKLPVPGQIWDEPMRSALNITAIREAQRRVTLRGELYEEIEALTEFDLGRLRPESAEIMPRVGELRDTIRTRITQTNYNTQYGFPDYQDFDFTVDALRLYAPRIEEDLTTGLFLMALDRRRRVTREPFVASPRN